MDVQRLVEISNELGFVDISKKLEEIEQKNNQEDCSLVVPLVGEFSSGKTTLINALTDSKKLETATKPTTATIYEVHFGSERCYATIMDETDTIKEIDNLEELKNDTLKDAKVVTVYDTSTKVPSSAILVDTPGLSSPDPKHKQTLVDFLPLADAILLVSDVNQQITKSVIDFVKTMALSKRPIYLVLTKCDTKAPSELEKAKEYIRENVKINTNNIVCISATNNNLDELYSLLHHIHSEKSKILQSVNAMRVKNIVEILLSRIDKLLETSKNDNGVDEQIRCQKYELDRLNRNIDNLLEAMSGDILEKGKYASRKFEDIISERLNSLATEKSNNFDADAKSAIDNTASLILNELKNDIRQILQKKASAKIGTDDAVELYSLKEIDLSQYKIGELSYNLNLNDLGHQYDGYISTGLKIGAAVAVVAAAAPAIGGAAAAGGAAATTGKLIDIADTVTDVGSIISNAKTVSIMKQVTTFGGKVDERYGKIEGQDKKWGGHVGSSKGIVESLVGIVTDSTMGKPQRRRAISNYMDDMLLPEFKSEINRIASALITQIGTSLHQEANETIQEMTNTLEELERIRKEKKEEYNNKMSLFRNYKNELLMI